jgi:hypothetical protein
MQGSVVGAVDPAQLQIAREYFEKLSHRMGAMAREHGHAKVNRDNATRDLYYLVLLTAVCGGVLLHPESLAPVAPQIPDAALNLLKVLHLPLATISAVTGVGASLFTWNEGSKTDARTHCYLDPLKLFRSLR